MRYFTLTVMLATFGGAFAQEAGTLDTSYDLDGKVVVVDYDSITNCAIVPGSDMAMVIAFRHTDNLQPRVRIIRLQEDGVIDSNFGNGGEVVVASVSNFEEFKVQTDGRLLLFSAASGAGGAGAIVTRYMSDGTLDSDFGAAGSAFVPGFGSPVGGLPLPDGRLLVRTSNRITRLLPNGALDSSFGNGGVHEVQATLQDMVLAPNGRIRCSQMGLSIPSEFDYDAQGGEFRYTLSAGYTADQNYLRNKIAVNHFGHTVGYLEGYVVAGSIFFYGGGFFRVTQAQVIPGQPSNHLHATGIMFNLQGGNAIGHTSIASTRPICADQSGNFLFATAVVSYGSINVNWPGNGTPAAPIWRVRRIAPGLNSLDESFAGGTDSSVPYEIGGHASFDSTEVPIPTGIAVQPDGKVVVVGYCKVDGAQRIVLARYHNIPDPRVRLLTRVFLGGAFDPDTGLMHDALREQGLLPTVQPYSVPAFPSPTGSAYTTVPQHVLAWEGDSAVVDWVWLELLDPNASSSVLVARAGLLHRNGWVTSGDGRSPIDFGIGAGSYLVRVRHRNHLNVTSGAPILLGADPTVMDFTDPSTPTWGNDAQMEQSGVRSMWPGNVNGDDCVKYMGQANDRDPILALLGGFPVTTTSPGYYMEDVNLDGWVKYVGANNDRDLILQVLNGDALGLRLVQQP